MKKFLTTKFLSTKHRNPNEVNQSVNQIQTKVEILSKEIQELEKQIRIETKVSEELEKQLNEEIDKNDGIDKEMEEMRKQKKILIENIETQEKEIKSAEQTERELQQKTESIENIFKSESEDNEKQINDLIAIRDYFQKQLEVKRRAYQSLNQTISQSFDSDFDCNQLELKKNELKTLQTEVESIETQIKEIRKKKNKERDIPPEVLQWFADPILVTIKIAKIKVESNRLQEIISKELNRRISLKSNRIQTKSQENNELNPILESIEKSSDIESESSAEQTVVANINVYEMGDNRLISTSFGLTSAQSLELRGTLTNAISGEQQNNSLSLFGNQFFTTSSANQSNISSTAIDLFSAQTPETDPFGPQKTDTSEESSSVQQSIGFSLFGNQSATSSSANQSVFNLFGYQSPPKNTSIGLEGLFGSFSEAGTSSTNKSEELFNFFK